MTLPVLKLNLSQLNNNGGTLGFDYIVGSLKDSDQFEIKEHNEVINPVKGCRGTIMYFNDRKIYLDFWEYSAPTHTHEALNANFDLVIKLQHKMLTSRDYVSFVRRKNMFPNIEDNVLKDFWRKIVPWTFFPSKSHIPYIGKEYELITKDQPKRFGFFCGRNWKARHGMKAKLDKENIQYICNEVEGARITDEAFMQMMKESQFGIVLPGRSTYVSDSKNRREVDYMMMRKPLLISYRPYYYDPFIDGVHYIFIDERTNFKALSSLYNIEQIAENAFEWYQNNATPKGIVKSFLRIMTDKGYV
jgi:hypothetical protein